MVMDILMTPSFCPSSYYDVIMCDYNRLEKLTVRVYEVECDA
jgi:hypothetical protein